MVRSGRRVAHLSAVRRTRCRSPWRWCWRRIADTSARTRMRWQFCCFQLAQHARYRRVAVAHGVFDHERRLGALAEIALQQRCLLFGVHAQRRAFLQPDAGVFCGGFFRARVEDDAVEDQPPQGARHFHHARVAEEFLQVGAYGLRRGRIRRAEIDQQDAGFFGGAVGVGRFGL